MPKENWFASPVLRLAGAAVIISFSGILVKTSHVAPTVSAFYRVFFGALTLILACAVKGEFKKRAAKKNGLAVLCGLLFALDLWAWHTSIGYVGPGLATLLGNCQVFVLAVVGILVFKERATAAFIISIPLAFSGLFLLIGVDIGEMTPSYAKGIGFGLATAVFYSMFLLLLRRIQSDKDDFSLFYYLMVVSASCSVFLGIQALLSGDSFLIGDTAGLLSLLCLGILIQAVAWMMISNALPQVKASLAGLILLLQPSLSFVWDVLIFSRPTGWIGWIGLLIVLAGIYLGMAGKTAED